MDSLQEEFYEDTGKIKKVIKYKKGSTRFRKSGYSIETITEYSYSENWTKVKYTTENYIEIRILRDKKLCDKNDERAITVIGHNGRLIAEYSYYDGKFITKMTNYKNGLPYYRLINNVEVFYHVTGRIQMKKEGSKPPVFSDIYGNTYC